MAGSKKSAKSVAEIEAELAASIEHTKKLRAEKKKALDEEKDAGRPVLMKALGKVKIGTMRTLTRLLSRRQSASWAGRKSPKSWRQILCEVFDNGAKMGRIFRPIFLPDRRVYCC